MLFKKNRKIAFMMQLQQKALKYKLFYCNFFTGYFIIFLNERKIRINQ